MKSAVPARTSGMRNTAGKPNKMKLVKIEEMINSQDSCAGFLLRRMTVVDESVILVAC